MKIVIHIGLHKTASGTLQRQFFPACENVNLLTTLDDTTRTCINDITRTDPAYFDPDATAATLRSRLISDRVNLISNESLSGPPYAGVVETGLDHRTPVIDNLRRSFPGAKVVVVIRRQDALARSLYRQYIKRGGTESIDRFYGNALGASSGILSRNRFKFCNFLELVDRSFAEGLKILLFEDFVNDRKSFLHELCEFIGTSVPDIVLSPENASSLGTFGMTASRYLNYGFRSMLNRGPLPPIPRKQYGRWVSASPIELAHEFWPGNGKPSQKVATVCRAILEECKDDNRRLARKFGLDLERYEYH
jgi:hypothetical protein